MEQPIEFCARGRVCDKCLMIGQPDDVLRAVGIAVSNITEENKAKPGVAARKAVAALYEIGMEQRKLGKSSVKVARTVDRIIKDQCDRYDLHGARISKEDSR